jgi:hypothetical protein
MYEEALKWFRENQKDMKEERLLLLENWLRMEEAHGSMEDR